MRCVAGLSIMWLWTDMRAKITNTAAFAKYTMRVIFNELDKTHGVVLGVETECGRKCGA
jgi:hypothetical protein